MTQDYAVTFACYNQRNYTEMFLNSLDRAEVDFSRIVAVDNGSTDGTREWLQTLGLGGVILNQHNMGCGVAWNQGALHLQARWTVVMNNDVVCHPGWLRNMLEAAEQSQYKIVSPSMVEGDLDYPQTEFFDAQQRKMQGHWRDGFAHAVCMAIHQDVWHEIGYFLPITRLMGYEDALFFRQARLYNVAMGTTANAWLHHFGMTTQKALMQEQKLNSRGGLGDVRLMRYYMNQSWWERKRYKADLRRRQQALREAELARFGSTVHGVKKGGDLRWF